jgi:pimeloyl-ACP methyl ester carboxylesterase
MEDRERGVAAAVSTALRVGERGASRARLPAREGIVVRDGVHVRWEEYGAGDPPILFLPTWSIIHARCWKLQIPDFARRHRVLAFDPRGNGGSDRPSDLDAYREDEFAADAIAVMDATDTARAVLVGFSLGAQRALILAGEHPERVLGLVLIGPALDLGLPLGAAAEVEFSRDTGIDEGWGRYNAHSWRRDYRGFLEFFFAQVFTEAHSTKQISDCVGWGLDTDAETLLTAETPWIDDARTRRLCAQVRCPVLVVHGDGDAVIPRAIGAEAARLTGARLLTFTGSGHCPQARDPVAFNLALREFVQPLAAAAPLAGRARWTRARARRRRALFVCSPIGLGHAWRDVAIADELRRLHPDVEIDWLAQHPVTAVLEARGERIHPASAELASESAHIESESAEHDLHCFGAWRRMDEIMVANFMVFHDVAAADPYDVWVADEGWEVDHFLHENPELKRAAYCWLTDFVGWIPMPDGGEREAFLTADYNAEMIEHIARLPRLRDRSIFVGNPADIVPETFGPDLPAIRDWTERHYDFAGYVTGFDPASTADREAIRAELGYRPDEKVCIVTVGGSGVGGALLRRVIAAFPEAKSRVPELRMVAVAGPRIDPATIAAPPGLEVRAYVHELYRHLAACDLAVVQGGLTTAMELTANGRPFLYFPLRHHFEQNFHVRHRLERYGAGRCMDFETSSPEDIARAIAAEIGRETRYAPVEADGAARAAGLIAEML